MPKLKDVRRGVDQNVIALRIRAERRRLNLTQRQAADRIGISRSTYRQLEDGTDPQLSTLIALADAGFKLRAVAEELFRMDGCEGWRHEIENESDIEKARKLLKRTGRRMPEPDVERTSEIM